jgi:hypothetical protein
MMVNNSIAYRQGQSIRTVFSFYGYLDQHFIDKIADSFDIDPYEVKDMLVDYGFDLRAVLDSPNPVIMCIFELVTDKLITQLEDYNLSNSLIEDIREGLRESIYVNAMCSGFEPLEVFQGLEDSIMDELKGQEERGEDRYNEGVGGDEEGGYMAKLSEINDVFTSFDNQSID